MTRLSLAALLCIVCMTMADPAHAQSACTDPAYRQFDFWLGDWEVSKPDGTVVGQNSIEKTYGGCVLQERYSTAGGYSGESLNTYDASRGLWHQTWVDNGGLLLLLDGRLVDGSMVLQSSGGTDGGAGKRHRITWTPNADGSVRQLWESTDAAGEWSVAFDGLYRRRDAAESSAAEQPRDVGSVQ